MERVLVVGATGNIGVAAIIAALRTKRNVLAIVRNQDSAEKLFKHVGTKEGITTVEADVVSENGVQGVVDQVKAGKLPSFQHVYSCVGRWFPGSLHEISTSTFREAMAVAFDSQFFAYRATVPYLIEQNNPKSTWTICTGAAAEYGSGGITAVTQGALWALTNAAWRENQKTNIRVNEAFLNARVEYDEDAEKKGVMKASDYARCYEQILDRPDIDGCRVSVLGPEDLSNLKIKKKADWKKDYE